MPLLAAVLGGMGAWAMSRLGKRFGWMDHPSDRSSHARATPKGGGIGILAAFVLASLWAGLPIGIWLPAAGLSLASLAGDRAELSTMLRLLLQFAAAAVVSWQAALQFPAAIPWQAGGLVLGSLAAAGFIVATANIYNFMDGINGLAGITGIIAFSLLAWVGWTRGGSSAWMLVAVALAAAGAGFLPFNFPRARVFMGDVGSILLGFIFAFFVVAWSENVADFLMFAAFLFPFYADESVTIIPRLRDGDSLSKPHRRHVYQILVNQMGRPHWKITILYGAVQLGIALVAIVLRPWGWIAEAAWLALTLVAGWRLAARVRLHEMANV